LGAAGRGRADRRQFHDEIYWLGLGVRSSSRVRRTNVRELRWGAGKLHRLVWVCLLAAMPIIVAACNQNGGRTY
jgi:hypothetical protein